MLKAESSDGLCDLVRRCRPLDRADATRFPGMRRVLEIRPSGRGWCVIDFHFVHSPKVPMSGIRPRRWGTVPSCAIWSVSVGYSCDIQQLISAISF